MVFSQLFKLKGLLALAMLAAAFYPPVLRGMKKGGLRRTSATEPGSNKKRVRFGGKQESKYSYYDEEKGRQVSVKELFEENKAREAVEGLYTDGPDVKLPVYRETPTETDGLDQDGGFVTYQGKVYGDLPELAEKMGISIFDANTMKRSAAPAKRALLPLLGKKIKIVRELQRAVALEAAILPYGLLEKSVGVCQWRIPVEAEDPFKDKKASNNHWGDELRDKVLPSLLKYADDADVMRLLGGGRRIANEGLVRRLEFSAAEEIMVLEQLDKELLALRDDSEEVQGAMNLLGIELGRLIVAKQGLATPAERRGATAKLNAEMMLDERLREFNELYAGDDAVDIKARSEVEKLSQKFELLVRRLEAREIYIMRLLGGIDVAGRVVALREFAQHQEAFRDYLAQALAEGRKRLLQEGLDASDLFEALDAMLIVAQDNVAWAYKLLSQFESFGMFLNERGIRPLSEIARMRATQQFEDSLN